MAGQVSHSHEKDYWQGSERLFLELVVKIHHILIYCIGMIISYYLVTIYMHIMMAGAW